MKRALVVAALALAAAGAGCEPAPPPVYGVTVYWQFVGWQGQVYGDFTNANTGCAAAGVDEVRIVLDGPGGVYDQTAACVQANGAAGVIVPAIPAGPYTLTVQGLRTGLAVYEQVLLNVAVPSPVLDTTLDAIYGDMNLVYTLPAAGSCAVGDRLAIALYDYDYNPSVVAWTTELPGAYYLPFPCAAPPGNVVTIPSVATSSATGYYRFNFISVVDANGFPVYQLCNWPAAGFAWNGFNQSVGANLLVASGTCPPAPLLTAGP